jgi:hypothetical protein
MKLHVTLLILRLERDPDHFDTVSRVGERVGLFYDTRIRRELNPG